MKNSKELLKIIKQKCKISSNNKAEINNKIENNNIEINNKIEEKNNLCNEKIREIEENTQKRDNEILTSVSENHKDIEGLQITQKYVNEKLICEEKEEEKEKEHCQYKRVTLPI